MKRTGWIAPAVFLTDRIAKMLAGCLPAEGQVLIPGVLRLRLTRNTGMAFSLFSGHPRLLGVLSLLIIGVAFLLLRGRKTTGLIRAGLMMMLGGAAGNAADRLMLGYVTDMIEPMFVRFAVFNWADACLVAGCLLAMAGIFRGGEEAPRKDGGCGDADGPEGEGRTAQP